MNIEDQTTTPQPINEQGKQRLRLYVRLMRLDKPIGIFLLLWPTLWALWIAAQGVPDLLVLFVFTFGVILMRSAGCVINDYADRHLDHQVARTRLRPVTTGQVSEKAALTLFVILCLSAFGLVLLMNTLTIYLSVGGALLAIVYPYMKRHTYLPQVVLGAAFGWSVPMAFAAQSGEIPPTGWLLYVATIVWATAYDTMYAMIDREDDLKAGIKSTAILLGNADRLAIGILQITLFVILVLAGQRLQLSWWYFGALGCSACTSLYQQYLLRSNDTTRYHLAFLNNNWTGALVFIGLLLHYVMQNLGS